jgi:hypothetical protein
VECEGLSKCAARCCGDALSIRYATRFLGTGDI